MQNEMNTAILTARTLPLALLQIRDGRAEGARQPVPLAREAPRAVFSDGGESLAWLFLALSAAGALALSVL
jgi:hypothetical protein